MIVLSENQLRILAPNIELVNTVWREAKAMNQNKLFPPV